MAAAAEIGLSAAFGAVIGSFLNVVIWRVPRRESLVTPGSRCPSCENPIAPYHNVPILSWFLLRGRCRTCGARISPRYPAVELLTAALFVAITLVRGFDSALLWELPFAAMLVAVAGIDLEHRIVPNRILAPAAIYALAVAALVRTEQLPELAAASAAALVAFLVAALAYPAGMGMGDVKLAAVMGLFLGLAVAPALLAAFLAGSVVGVAMMALQGTSARKQGVPFAPFLALGSLVGLLAGPELVELYVDRFL